MHFSVLLCECVHFRYHIIKRRVLWLLGCWVGVKFDAVYHPTLYQCILTNLGPNENVLVSYFRFIICTVIATIKLE